MGDRMIDVREPLLTETDVAKLLHVSLGTIRRWRIQERGPQFVKLGASVRYRREAVSDWLQHCPTGGGDDPQSNTGVRLDRN